MKQERIPKSVKRFSDENARKSKKLVHRSDINRSKRALAIMQPTYLPYLGYFVLMAAADRFYFLDDVQFARQSWQQRNRLLSKDGEKRLTIEVIKQPLQTPICDIGLDNAKPWRQAHWDHIKSTYDRHPYYREGLAFFEAHLFADHTKLSDFTIGLIIDGAQRLGLETPTLRTSSLVAADGRSDRLVALNAHAGASDYLSPIGAKDYLESDGVLAQHVRIHYMLYDPKPYPQNRADFIPYLGFLDAVMALGFAATGAMVRAAVKPSFATLFE